jgi:prevent-host-death family protein
MAQTTVGIRDLKAQLSHYLRQVAQGDTIVITDHGKPVGQITPIAEDLDARMKRLVETGVVAWSGRRYSPTQPPVEKLKQDVMISDLLLEDRE